MLIVEKIFDVSTGKETIIEREETAEEKELREQNEQLFAKLKADATAKATAKAALLERLGITEEEAKLLLS